MITFSAFKENPFSVEIIIFLFYTGNIPYNMKKYNSHIGRKFERKTFKLLIGGSTASNACSMQGYKSEKMRLNTAFFKKTIDERHVL